MSLSDSQSVSFPCPDDGTKMVDDKIKSKFCIGQNPLNFDGVMNSFKLEFENSSTSGQ